MNFWKVARVQYVKQVHTKIGGRRRFVRDYKLKKYGISKDSLKSLDKEQKLEKLKEQAELQLPAKFAAHVKTRLNFNSYVKEVGNFYKRWPNCFVCKENETNHIHHIIGVRNGGRNNKENLIGVCRDCHKSIHPWLN